MTEPALQSQHTQSMVDRRIITILACKFQTSQPYSNDLAARNFELLGADILQVMGASIYARSPGLILARFGHLEMGETDAERAILAALQLLNAKHSQRDLAALSLKIGIATGLVWSSAGDPDETPRKGSSVEALATALQERAQSDAILIAESTREFVKGLFEYRNEPQIVLRNFAEPVHAFTVARPSQIENRFEALRSQRLRFVGRERELSMLRQHWKSAEGGSGQVALIVGEQGIGKSRLAAEFDRQFDGVPFGRARLYASPNHTSSVLYPFARLLARLCCFGRPDTEIVKQSKLKNFLDQIGVESAQDFEVFTDVLGISEGVATEDTTRKKRELILNAFLKLFETQAKQGSLVIVFEDLHWADPTSHDLLGLMVKRMADLRVLVVATTRPQYRPNWTDAPYVRQITLGPLKREETAAVVSFVSNNKAISSRFIDHVIDCTGGVPLFVEELTKVLTDTRIPLQNEDGRQAPHFLESLVNLPVTIHAALLARIERLGDGKAVAQNASALGPKFQHDLLVEIAGKEAPELNSGLARLIDAGIILRRGFPPNAEYLFKHVLIQEAAYSTIPGEERKALHLRIARALEIPGNRSAEPHIIAHHLTLAGEYASAACYWLRAGRETSARSANKETVEQLKEGLKALRRAPRSNDQDRLERRLLLYLGPAVMAVQGYGAPEAQTIFERARDLVDETTPAEEKLGILCGLWNVRFGRSELSAAIALAQQFLDLAEASGSGNNLAHCMMGQTLSAMGEFAQARHHLQLIVDKIRRGQKTSAMFSADEFILALSYISRVLWALGYPDQSAAASEEAVSRARNGADSIAIAIALVARMFMTSHGAALDAAIAHADEAIAHCSQHNLGMFEHWTRFNQGALLVKQGDILQGVETMRSAIRAADAARTLQFRPFQLSCLAESYLKLGDLRQALETIDEAITMAVKTGEKQSEPGLHRVRGKIVLALGNHHDARREFELALNIARRQGAKLEELRVALEIAKQKRGFEGCEEARIELASIYSTFTEGHDLPELKLARSYLDETELP